MKQGDGITEWDNGKVKFILTPQVYYDFVCELNKNHEDLLRAMTLAQVKLSDYSVFDFLNNLLGTNVKRDTPPEVGFAQLLDALRMRKTNQHSQAAMDKVASQFQNHSMFPSRSDPSKPLFPDEADQ